MLGAAQSTDTAVPWAPPCRRAATPVELHTPTSPIVRLHPQRGWRSSPNNVQAREGWLPLQTRQHMWIRENQMSASQREETIEQTNWGKQLARVRGNLGHPVRKGDKEYEVLSRKIYSRNCVGVWFWICILTGNVRWYNRSTLKRQHCNPQRFISHSQVILWPSLQSPPERWGGRWNYWEVPKELSYSSFGKIWRIWDALPFCGSDPCV